MDYEADPSTQKRLDFRARYADQPVLVLGTHFAIPTAGKIVHDSDAYRLDVD